MTVVNEIMAQSGGAIYEYWQTSHDIFRKCRASHVLHGTMATSKYQGIMLI